ncbi:MAG: hypothetical protein HOO06_08480 [Bdellovibrionaceae bacterium]|jgi:hypothetical protein|nr:hypothetical protein [Pseudobdellovibrionaceae bacterium]
MKNIFKIVLGLILMSLMSACGDTSDSIQGQKPSGDTSDTVSEKLTLSSSNASNFDIPENSSALFIFMLSGTTTVDTKIDWAIYPDGGGSAMLDFLSVAGTITIPAGEQSVTFSLPIDDDSDYEGNESFKWIYVGVSDHVEVSSNEFTFTLIDNEVAPGPPVSFDIAPANFDEDAESIISLNYSDADSDIATACTISGLSNISISTPCSCDGTSNSNACSVGVTGVANHNGAAGFSYTVTANAEESASANAVLAIDNVDDIPVANALTPDAFDEDTESIITLGYTDIDTDLATACAIPSFPNLSVSTPCSCNGSGECTVGVKGISNFSGAASFSYTVTANGAPSAAATASFTINAVDDKPIAIAVTAPAFDEGVESIISLDYTDAENHTATACAISDNTDVTVSTACDCTAPGVCTVGVTGNGDFNGVTSFNFTVTANTLISDAAVASLTVTAIDDKPVASPITPASFNEDSESILTLSYSDIENDLATACTIVLNDPSNISVSTACSCDVSGDCTVGVTGVSNYSGAESFNYTVTANGQTSAAVLASLTIDAVNDAPSLATNLGLSSSVGEIVVLTTTELNATDSDDANSNITFELKTAPVKGDLKLSGAVLSSGGLFTQSDLDNSLVTYVHTAGTDVDDSFQISVRDDDSVYAVGATDASPATVDVVVSNCVSGSVTYTADGSFDVDATAPGCANIVIKAWGGGAGGGYKGGSAAGLGGGGGYAEKAMSISAGQVYTIAVGMGGQGGACGAAAGAGGFSGGAGGLKEANGSAGADDAGGPNGGAGGSGVNGTNGGQGGYGGGGGGGAAEDGMLGGAGGGASTFFNGITKLVVAGGGGGGGAGEAGGGGAGGAACAINGSDALSNGDSLGGAGGGGGGCFGDTVTSGSGSVEGNSANSGGAGAGGNNSGSCPASNGTDGKLIVEYN